MKSETVKFTNESNHELVAKIDFPDTEIKAFALFAHCFTCNKNLTAVRNISRALNANGIAVLRFDFTGLGESEGEFEDTNFSSNVSDIVMAANFLAKNYEAPSILIGHSLGGAAIVFAAKKIDSIKSMVTIGAPANPKHVTHLFKSSIDEIKEKGKALLNIGGRSFNIKKQFLDDINEKNMKETLSETRIPILVMHSPQDTTVGIENAAMIYEYSWHPKSFVTLDNADHLLSNKRDSLYAGSIISVWTSRYLED